MLKQNTETGELYEDGQPNFSWVENNIEPLRITVTKKTPDWVDATSQPLQNPDASPADIAAYRLVHSNKRPNRGPVEQIIIPDQPKRPGYVMEPDLQETQGGMHFPEGLMQDDSGRMYYKDDPTKTIPMVKRPTLIPVAFTPEGLKPVMPKLADLVGNIVSPLAAGRLPIKAGEMVLGSGAIRTTPEALKQAEPFYSALERAVNGAKLDKGTPDQWLGYLRNQPGVKQEEIATVLGELPAGQLTKNQMQELVKQNKIELKEKVLGTNNIADMAKEAKWRVKNLGETQEQANAFVSKSYKPDVPTKYHDYQLPGGENYKEMLLTLPEKTNPIYQKGLDLNKRIQNGEFNSLNANERRKIFNERDTLLAEGKKIGENQYYKSSHWDEPNVLVHIRMNDRNIEGKKVLHLEEIQSDLHQAGRKQGYKLSEKQKGELESIESKISEKLSDAELGNPDMKVVLQSAIDKKIITPEEAKNYEAFSKGENSNIPDAPFKKNWDELALKRMIRHAAENDYHGISWTPGDAQAARYDLSKQIDEIQATRQKDGTYHIGGVDKKNGLFTVGANVAEKDLADHIGKDLAEKIKDQVIPTKTYSGLDLKIGGEGMKAFYDKMLIDRANALGKKYGSKVEQRNLNTQQGKILKRPNGEYYISFPNGASQNFKTAEEAQKFMDSGGQPIHYLPITPQLKAKAMEEGFPLFSLNPTLIPVDHQPEFKDNKKYKLVPISENPFK